MEGYFCWHSMILLSLLFLPAISSSTIISGGGDGSLYWDSVTGRNLLQAKKDCPVTIESLNYTILTSQCKQPYTVNPCCDAFKQFVCPIAGDFNDVTNNCAEILFSYIAKQGFPTGLFSTLCHDTKEGLTCPATPPASPSTPSSNGSGDRTLRRPSLELLFSTSILILLLLLELMH